MFGHELASIDLHLYVVHDLDHDLRQAHNVYVNRERDSSTFHILHSSLYSFNSISTFHFYRFYSCLYSFYNIFTRFTVYMD